ncbi:MAG: amino acid adenylation domain-containing protein, partial [Desulfofustis sp.]
MNVTSHSPVVDSSATDLTISQRRIWTGQMLNPDKPLYNMAMAFRIDGTIEASTFSTAFQQVIDTSDALRTIFLEHDGRPFQRIIDKLRFDTELIDISDSPSPDEAAELLLKQRAQTQFVLEERLFDSALFQLDHDRYIWFINQHHLICDAWSCAVLHQRLADYYQLALTNRLEEAAHPPQFQDYRIAENIGRNNPEGIQAAQYWAEKFSHQRNGLELYGQRADPATTSTSRISCDIGRERSAKLRELAGKAPLKSISRDLSLFYLFTALLFTYIHRISGQDDLVIGSPSHNRSKLSDKQTLGLFIELFPLQLRINSGDTFRSLIDSVIPEANQLLRNALPGASSEVPVDCYSVVLNYLNVQFGNFYGMPSRASWIHSGYGDRGHALRLQVHDFGQSGSFTLLFDVHEEIFPPSLRKHAAGHFLKLMDALLENLDTCVEHIPLLSNQETEQLVNTYNDTVVSPPPELTIVELIKAQVDRVPEAIAISENEVELTYAQLDEISEQMALNLKQLGISSDDFVAVYMDRSTPLIVSLLAILKAGAAFVPIDTAFPEQRLAYVLEDCGCNLVLTSGDLNATLPATTVQVIEYEEISGKTASEHPTGIDLEALDHRSLAYMIYTSGSTGRPKGVMIEHRSLLNYLCWARKEYMADGPHDLPLFSSVAADLTITSLFLPLISGSSVVVYPEGKDGLDLSILEVYKDDRVDIIKLTPSHLALLDGSEAPPAGVKKLIVGGEDFKASLARRVSSLYGGNITIYNEYGPTEATIGCMIYRFSPELDTQASVAIGKPIDNLRIYLLDKALNPLPAGVKGDLYIGGAGLARGYHNLEEMTAEKFIEDPFCPGEKIYCSGDIGRWRSAGVMDYLGRNDDQVKVRGYRIERGEIEAALCEIGGISESFCKVVELSKPGFEEPLARCRTCGLPANVPKADLDDNEICAPCRNFEKQRHLVEQYFKSEDELDLILEQAKQTSRGRYDCLIQYSGGKDSTFVLYKLVEMGMRPLVFSFDNGFIPESVKDNVRRIVDDLGLDLHWGRTGAMNEIFVDSLRRFS